MAVFIYCRNTVLLPLTPFSSHVTPGKYFHRQQKGLDLSPSAAHCCHATFVPLWQRHLGKQSVSACMDPSAVPPYLGFQALRWGEQEGKLEQEESCAGQRARHPGGENEAAPVQTEREVLARQMEMGRYRQEEGVWSEDRVCCVCVRSSMCVCGEGGLELGRWDQKAVRKAGTIKIASWIKENRKNVATDKLN